MAEKPDRLLSPDGFEEAGPAEPASGRSWTRVLVAMALFAAGAGVYLGGSTLQKDSTRVLGGNPPINSGATDLADIRAHNSPTVVLSPVNPNSLVAVNRIDQPLFGCAMHISLDGGARWAPREIPFPPGEESPPRCFAPDAAFAVDGTLYVSFVTLKGTGNVPNAGWLVSSKDGGRTLSAPTRVLAPLSFQTRLVADPVKPKTLYMTYLRVGEVGNLLIASEDNPVELLRSDDGGLTWKGPIRISSAKSRKVVSPSLAVGPEGELYVLYLDVGEDVLDYQGGHEGKGGPPYEGKWSLILARSFDRGAKWDYTVVEPNLVPTQRFIVFFPPSPSISVSRSGRVYVGFQDGRLGDPDIWLWSSGNSGQTFSTPVRVNDTPREDGTSQYLPRLASSPAGRLDILYYDRRDDQKDVMTEASLQSSFDGGKTFRKRVRLSSQPFDSRIGFGSARMMPESGSRLGLIAGRHRALAVWADTRVGTEGSNKQDLASAVVAFAVESAWRQPLRLAGIGIAAAGGVVLALWMKKPRTP